ncbi:MAG: HAD-IIIC family phosphatase [Nitrospirales bacterium]|nr:HAD-IIIC family phosphatase [Nitrospirales bacterium]
MEYKSGSFSTDPRVEVLATFVADPVVAILRYWFHEFGYEAEFLPTSYGQLFPRLLIRNEPFQASDIHVVLFAVRDLIPQGERANVAEHIHPNVVEFVNVLTSGVATRGGIWIVVRCLDPVAHISEEALEAFNQQAEYIAAHLPTLAQTTYLDATNLGATYQIASFFDDHTDERAHIPYTDAYYTAIGTSVFRAIRSRLGQVYKLIVTDCDGTLWDGVCGEMEPEQLSILPHFKWLHAWLQQKKMAGMLLAICSRNNADDVEAVFAQRNDLDLALTDFTAHRINWKEKAENIQDLARELKIALDSIIFLDNDPVQRNKVRATLPHVLVPELPAEPIAWPSYLEQVWAFDTFWVTEEGRRRTSLYREHADREHVRSRSSSFAEFLKELGLQVSMTPATEKDIPRLFELVNRVTQFNANGIRIKESDIAELILTEQGEWLAVRVEDRFGNYGLVGAMACRYETDCWTIGSLLLSCRALGRGVEHQMVRLLGQRALSKSIGTLRFEVAQTSRNSPAVEFFKRLSLSEPDLHAGWFQLDAVRAASLSHDDALPTPDSADQSATGADGHPRPNGPMGSIPQGESERILAATISVQDIPALYRKAQSLGDRAQPGINSAHIAPHTETEQRMMAIFQDLLGHDHIGVDEEFFDVGGHSLLAMRLLSRIKDAFDVDLPIRLMFMQRLTIANLAGIVETSFTTEENTAEIDTIKHTLDSFSDKELAELFGNLEAHEDSQG